MPIRWHSINSIRMLLPRVRRACPRGHLVQLIKMKYSLWSYCRFFWIVWCYTVHAKQRPGLNSRKISVEDGGETPRDSRYKTRNQPGNISINYMCNKLSKLTMRVVIVSLVISQHRMVCRSIILLVVTRVKCPQHCPTNRMIDWD